MKRIFLFALLTSAFVFAAVGSAGNGKETHFGPFASTSPDNGSCNNPWAVDTFDRDFKVKDNGDGTFTVREEFKNGSFVTNAGFSPGACEGLGEKHGATVAAGITGNMHGEIQGTVTSTTFNPNGCDVNPTLCTTTTGFLLAVFGPSGASFTGDQYKFEYSAGDQGLIYHHWEDKSNPAGGSDLFKGDIANA
jgi:hypothetical protein